MGKSVMRIKEFPKRQFFGTAISCKLNKKLQVSDMTKLICRPSADHLQMSLQHLAVPKAQIRKLPFWAIFDLCNRFAHNSTGSSPNELELS
jgi:hypothetical protein